MNNDPLIIHPFDLPPDYLRRRWAGLGMAEDNPLFRIAAWRRNRRRVPGAWIMQGIAIGAGIAALIHTNYIWLTPVALLLYFMLVGNLSRHRTLTLLFGCAEPDFLQSLYLTPMNYYDMAFARVAIALSRRRLATVALAIAVVSLYYAWLAWQIRSIFFLFVCDGLLITIALVGAQLADLIMLHWHCLYARAVWNNRNAGLGRRLSFIFDIAGFGCVMCAFVVLVFLICIGSILLSFHITDAIINTEDTFLKLSPLLIGLTFILTWIFINHNRAKKFIQHLQGYYFNILTIEASGEHPVDNPYVSWLGEGR